MWCSSTVVELTCSAFLSLDLLSVTKGEPMPECLGDIYTPSLKTRENPPVPNQLPLQE